jgi:hypothetical protein
MRHLERSNTTGSKSRSFFLEPLFELVYVQQKSSQVLYSGKSIYKRNSESLSNIVNLANLAVEEGDKETVLLNFVLVNTKDLDLLIQAHAYLIRIKIENAEEKDFTNKCREVINRI